MFTRCTFQTKYFPSQQSSRHAALRQSSFQTCSRRSIVQLYFLHVSVLWSSSCLQRADFLRLSGASKWMAPPMHFYPAWSERRRERERWKDEVEGRKIEMTGETDWWRRGASKSAIKTLFVSDYWCFYTQWQFLSTAQLFSRCQEWIYFILVVSVAPLPLPLHSTPPPPGAACPSGQTFQPNRAA